MYTLLLVIHSILALSIIALVLMQRPEQDGIGTLAGGGNAVFSARGKATFFTKATAYCALGFMLTSLVLAKMVMDRTDSSVLDSLPAAEISEKQIPQEPITPTVPRVE